MMTEADIREELNLRYMEVRTKMNQGLEEGTYEHGFIEALEMVLGIDPKVELQAEQDELENP
jgi:hypothetical protein